MTHIPALLVAGRGPGVAVRWPGARLGWDEKKALLRNEAIWPVGDWTMGYLISLGIAALLRFNQRFQPETEFWDERHPGQGQSGDPASGPADALSPR